MSVAEQYARWVLEPENEHETGRLVKLSAKRFISDLVRTDIYFDETEANKFVAFAENHCCLWEDKWRGKPVILEPWMQFIFQQVYGWFYTETKLRRIRRVYVQVAKKNAKSTLCGVLANFHLFADQRIQTPKIFVGANNDEQAKICVNIAGKIIQQSPDLCDYVDDKRVTLHNYGANIHTVVHRERDGFIKSVAKETGDKNSKQAGGKHGINPSLYIIDEYGMADSSDLLDTFKTAQAAREEPLGFVITTAGHKHNGPCFSQLRRTGIEVLEGLMIDDTSLSFIYESDSYYLDEEGNKKKDEQGRIIRDSIYDRKTWKKSNPNMDVSVFPAFLEDQVLEAKNEGGNKEVNVRTLNFNEWCETPEVWIPKETWDQNAFGYNLEDLEGLECYGGLQIISGKELNALALLFPYVKPDLHVVRMLFWLPEKALLVNNEKQDFKQWRNHLLVCEGNVIDNDFIFDSLMAEISKYQLHSLSFPVNQEKHDIVQALVREGVECNPISQGYRGNSEPTFTWESLINAHQIEHFNNPVLAWTNSQCMAIRRGDEIRVERAGSRTAGIVACINALAQWKTIEANDEEAGMTYVQL